MVDWSRAGLPLHRLPLAERSARCLHEWNILSDERQEQAGAQSGIDNDVFETDYEYQ